MDNIQEAEKAGDYLFCLLHFIPWYPFLRPWFCLGLKAQAASVQGRKPGDKALDT
jgi:hypothetical protein